MYERSDVKMGSRPTPTHDDFENGPASLQGSPPETTTTYRTYFRCNTFSFTSEAWFCDAHLLCGSLLCDISLLPEASARDPSFMRFSDVCQCTS
mmetsp:Transcript_102256/g.259710  ORF Transcript_102256/g.259710 Transcript_102256/m.259710 type:complete len:94 (-) Transcript_102256:976-1257(-)